MAPKTPLLANKIMASVYSATGSAFCVGPGGHEYVSLPEFVAQVPLDGTGGVGEQTQVCSGFEELWSEQGATQCPTITSASGSNSCARGSSQEWSGSRSSSLPTVSS